MKKWFVMKQLDNGALEARAEEGHEGPLTGAAQQSLLTQRIQKMNRVQECKSYVGVVREENAKWSTTVALMFYYVERVSV